MPIIPIPYGGGLERADGIMTRQPNTFEDLRNVYLYSGKAQVRKGLIDPGTVLTGDLTTMLAPLRWLSSSVAASYTDGTGAINLTRLNILGLNPIPIGVYGTRLSSAQYNPPVTVAADSDSILLLADAEPNFQARIQTRYYDPTNPAAADNLYDLTAELGIVIDGVPVVENVKFRGVTRHLSYIFGWGHGQDNADGPNTVRVSNSNDPLIFQDFAFFEAGQQAEPVMVCRSAGQYLMTFKENETYQIFGYSPDTFGIRPSDTLFGCVGERLAVTVGNVVFFWSTQGPRMTTGGESQDLSIPLDIDAPDPLGIAATVNPKDAFAEYDPQTRVVQFVWGSQVYALSIRNPSQPKWSYYELGEAAQCGSQFFVTEAVTGGGGLAPTGNPIITAVYPHGPGVAIPGDAGASEDPQDFTIILDNDGDGGSNPGSTGGEFVEVHIRMYSTPGLADVGYVPIITFLPVGGAEQRITIKGSDLDPNEILPLWHYDFSVRYQRGNQYSPGAEGTPDTWPAQDDVQTDEIEAKWVARASAGAFQGVWLRTSGAAQQITLTLEHAPGHQYLNFGLEREIKSNGNPSVQDIGSGIGPPDTGDQVQSPFATVPVPTAPGEVLEVQLVDSTPISDRFNNYRSRYVGLLSNDPEVPRDGGWSLELPCWPGPDEPNANSLTPNGYDVDGNVVNVGWNNASTGTIPANREMDPYSLNATQEAQFEWSQQTWNPNSGAPPSGGSYIFVTPEVELDDEGRIGMRYKVLVFGVLHYSPWTLVDASINYITGMLGVTE